MSQVFREYDFVRIAHFKTPIQERHVDSSFLPPHTPKVGDTGTIVFLLDGANFVVEDFLVQLQ